MLEHVNNATALVEAGSDLLSHHGSQGESWSCSVMVDWMQRVAACVSTVCETPVAVRILYNELTNIRSSPCKAAVTFRYYHSEWL